MVAIVYVLSAVFQTSFDNAAAAAISVVTGDGGGLGGEFGSAFGFGTAVAVDAANGVSGDGFWGWDKLWIAAGDLNDTVFLVASAWFLLRFFR